MSKLTCAQKTGLGHVLKAEHQHWSHAKSPEKIGLDFSLCRYVLLLASILTGLGSGNMAEIIIECKQDDGKPQTVWIQNTHLPVPAEGGHPCRMKA